MNARRLGGISAFAFVAAAVLRASAPAGPANLTRGCVDRVDASADYFPDKVRLDDARKFVVEYHRTYKVVTVNEPDPGAPSEQYVLVQCGTPRPALTGALAAAQVVDIPIRSMFPASTTHVPPLIDLGRLDVLTGVDRITAGHLAHTFGDATMASLSLGTHGFQGVRGGLHA